MIKKHMSFTGEDNKGDLRFTTFYSSEEDESIHIQIEHKIPKSILYTYIKDSGAADYVSFIETVLFAGEEIETL